MKEKERAVRKRAALLTVDKGEVSFNSGKTKVKVVVSLEGDVSIPTNRSLESRRPNMLVQLKDRKTLYLFEMACAYDALLEERQSEKAASTTS